MEQRDTGASSLKSSGAVLSTPWEAGSGQNSGRCPVFTPGTLSPGTLSDLFAALPSDLKQNLQKVNVRPEVAAPCSPWPFPILANCPSQSISPAQLSFRTQFSQRLLTQSPCPDSAPLHPGTWGHGSGSHSRQCCSL